MSVRCFVEAEMMSGNAGPVTAQVELPQEMDREKVRIMVLGSLEGVNNIVQSLHKLRFAEAGQWSQPLPTGRPGEVMRILTKVFLRGEG